MRRAHLWPLTCVWKTQSLCPHVCDLCFPHFPLISLDSESCDPRSLLLRGECWYMCCSGLNITCREKRGGCKNCQVTAFPVILLPRESRIFSCLLWASHGQGPLSRVSLQIHASSLKAIYIKTLLHTCLLPLHLSPPHDPLGSSRCFAYDLWTGLGCWIPVSTCRHLGSDEGQRQECGKLSG